MPRLEKAKLTSRLEKSTSPTMLGRISMDRHQGLQLEFMIPF